MLREVDSVIWVLVSEKEPEMRQDWNGRSTSKIKGDSDDGVSECDFQIHGEGRGWGPRSTRVCAGAEMRGRRLSSVGSCPPACSFSTWSPLSGREMCLWNESITPSNSPLLVFFSRLLVLSEPMIFSAPLTEILPKFEAKVEDTCDLRVLRILTQAGVHHKTRL